MIFRALLILAFFLVAALPAPALAQLDLPSGPYGRSALQPAGECLPDGRQTSGALYRICMPRSGAWNGDLVILAHGYVAESRPLAIPNDQLALSGGPSIQEAVNSLGYAFAVTSYSTNGLAVLQGMADVADLARIFRSRYPQTRHIYLIGVSEGGLVTALAVEQHPDTFSGGLAACGPIGDFDRQVNYWGDFRVAFDYFFPGMLPPSPVAIPAQLLAGSYTTYAPRVARAVQSNPYITAQLLSVAGAPVDPGNRDSVVQTVLGLLWYNVTATNDGIAGLGGQPFDNLHRLYLGADNNIRLNLGVQRFGASPRAAAEIAAHYQTTGRLAVPLVTLHTAGDPIIPAWHESLYAAKVRSSGSLPRYSNVMIERYGHCAFRADEVLAAFSLLVQKVTGPG